LQVERWPAHVWSYKCLGLSIDTLARVPVGGPFWLFGLSA